MSDDEWIEYCRNYNLNPTNISDYNSYKETCKTFGIPLEIPTITIPKKPLPKTPPQMLEKMLQQDTNPEECTKLLDDSKNPLTYNNSKHIYNLKGCDNKLNIEYPEPPQTHVQKIQDFSKKGDIKLQEQLSKLKDLANNLTTGDVIMLGLLALSISILLHLSIEQYIEDNISDPSAKIDTAIKAFMVTFMLFLILGVAITYFGKDNKIIKNVGLSCLVVSLLEFYKLFSSLFTKFISSGNKGKIAGFWIFGLVLLIFNFAIIGLNTSLKDYYNIIGSIEWFILIAISFGLAFALFANKPL